jgi:membrane protease YdiL (CAAX protease family)
MSRFARLLKPYHRLSRTGTYGFIAALPLLLFYEAGMMLAGRNQAFQVRIGAEIWIKDLLALLGGTGLAVLSVSVVLLGLGIFWFERKKDIPIRPKYFAWIVAESAVYAVFAAMLVSTVVGWVFAMIAPAGLSGQPLWVLIALSIGAGLYEELLFRVILVGGLYWALRKLTGSDYSYLVAALVGAAIFSLVHYIGPLGDPFQWASFTFRFLFGLLLNAIFLARGFAVAAWTHALYDIMVVTRFFG